MRQAEAGGLLSFRLAWSTLRPCLKKKKKKEKKKRNRREGRRYTFSLLQLLKKDIF
jgi:hypothetical protein